MIGQGRGTCGCDTCDCLANTDNAVCDKCSRDEHYFACFDDEDDER